MLTDDDKELITLVKRAQGGSSHYGLVALTETDAINFIATAYDVPVSRIETAFATWRDSNAVPTLDGHKTGQQDEETK